MVRSFSPREEVPGGTLPSPVSLQKPAAASRSIWSCWIPSANRSIHSSNASTAVLPSPRATWLGEYLRLHALRSHPWPQGVLYRHRGPRPSFGRIRLLGIWVFSKNEPYREPKQVSPRQEKSRDHHVPCEVRDLIVTLLLQVIMPRRRANRCFW